MFRESYSTRLTLGVQPQLLVPRLQHLYIATGEKQKKAATRGSSAGNKLDRLVSDKQSINPMLVLFHLISDLVSSSATPARPENASAKASPGTCCPIVHSFPRSDSRRGRRCIAAMR